jgi:hypothetical protein
MRRYGIRENWKALNRVFNQIALAGGVHFQRVGFF